MASTEDLLHDAMYDLSLVQALLVGARAVVAPLPHLAPLPRKGARANTEDAQDRSILISIDRLLEDLEPRLQEAIAQIDDGIVNRGSANDLLGHADAVASAAKCIGATVTLVDAMNARDRLDALQWLIRLLEMAHEKAAGISETLTSLSKPEELAA